MGRHQHERRAERREGFRHQALRIENLLLDRKTFLHLWNGAERGHTQLAPDIVGGTDDVEQLLAPDNEQRRENQAGQQRQRHVENDARLRSEENTSELQSLMRISYAV